jgi:Calx-beta domain
MRHPLFGSMGNKLHNLFKGKTGKPAARRRRTTEGGPVAVEMLEERVLLSATAGCDELTDVYGNEYDALAAPDPTLSPDTTGDFDGTGTLAALSDTFFLHSNPGASQTIYLDFDGSVTSGTVWNSSFTGGADIVTPAFDFEGGTSVFTDNELARIQYIWQRVAEDYLPFDVDVTTQDPGSAALTKSGSGDSAWGIRVAIGGNGSWYGSAGGVAYVGSFNWNSDTPIFAFSDALLDSEKYICDGISHEVGHSLGLSHDGASGTEYFQGYGSGETGWAPIMGVGYYQNLTQWSKGEYSGANNHQDDLAIITSQNGFGYRVDDYGNTNAAAGSLSISGTSVSGSGIIERSTDVDVFAFSTGAGTISFDATGVYRGSNLDILLELYDANGNLIVSANPTDQLGASFSVTVGAGVYYLHIDGVGKGDPATGGYSDYASLGGYRISGTIVGGGQTLPTYYSVGAQSADKAEGDSGTTAFTFIVSRSGDTSQSGSVSYAFQGSGTNAASANDFSGGFGSGTVSFAAGETSKTITIYVAGDMNVEADEDFVVMLSNATNGGQIGTGQATGHIRNDDTPGITVSPTSGLTVDESGTTASFSVVLTHPPTADVHIAVTSGDTTEGTVSVTSLVFTAANWNVPQTVTITGVDDTIVDGNQNFWIYLGPVTSSDANYNGLDPVDVLVTCRDNDSGGGTTGKGSGTKGGGGGGGGWGKGGGPKKTPSLVLTDESSGVTVETGSGESTTFSAGVVTIAFRDDGPGFENHGQPESITVAVNSRTVYVGHHSLGGEPVTEPHDGLLSDSTETTVATTVDDLFSVFEALETEILAA